MKNLHAFIWSMETYNKNSTEATATWNTIQLIFEISEEIMKLLGLPLEKEYSMYSACWATSNKKILPQIIPDVVILDSIMIEEKKAKYPTRLGTVWISGKFGLDVNEFSAYSDAEAEERIYDVTVDTAKSNNPYIPLHYSYQDDNSYVKESTELREENINLSPQAKVYLTCLIGRDLLWNGRSYKFQVLQYTEEMVEAEKKELVEKQLEWVDALCDYYGADKESGIIRKVREFAETAPDKYDE